MDINFYGEELMYRIFIFFFIFISACSAPAQVNKKEVTELYTVDPLSARKLSSLESHLIKINFAIDEAFKEERKVGVDAKTFKEGLGGIKLLSESFEDFRIQKYHNDITIASQQLGEKLDGIKNQLVNISNTLYNNYNKDSWKEVVKSIAPIVAGIFIFIWSLMNLTISEARAKMSYISPLIDKSSSAIVMAYEKIGKGSPLENEDITKIIEPIIRIGPFFNEDNFVELIIQSNEKAFVLMKMCLPSNIITEIESRDLLNTYLNSGVGSSTIQSIRTTLVSQYDSALNDFIRSDKKVAPLNVRVKRWLILFFSTGLLGVFYYASLS